MVRDDQLRASHAPRLRLYSRASPPSICHGVCRGVCSSAAHLRARRCLYSRVGVVATVVYVLFNTGMDN